MNSVEEIVPNLVLRQALNTITEASQIAIAAAATPSSSRPACDETNAFDGRIGVRISAIFVILVGSLFGTAVPTFSA